MELGLMVSRRMIPSPDAKAEKRKSLRTLQFRNAWWSSIWKVFAREETCCGQGYIHICLMARDRRTTFITRESRFDLDQQVTNLSLLAFLGDGYACNQSTAVSVVSFHMHCVVVSL